MIEEITKFEKSLAKFTGAPFAITTDCCTHAIELCLRYEQVEKVEFTAFTYINIPMIMKKLNINYKLINEKWIGEYRFYNTRIWDSARLLSKNMFKGGMMQCVSFGSGKPIDIDRGGAILLDDKRAYEILAKMRYNGIDIKISPWYNQINFTQGFHYKLNPQECIRAHKKLKAYTRLGKYDPIFYEYYDLRKINID